MKRVYVLCLVVLAAFMVYSPAAMSAVPVTSGLVLQLDASDCNTDGSSKVTSWTDLSGHNNNAAQTADANRPILASNMTPGGGSAVRFDGTSDYLSIVPNATLDGGNWTIFAVYASGGKDSGSGSDRIINFGYADIEPNSVVKPHPTVYTMIVNGTTYGVRSTSRTVTGGGIFGSTVPVPGYAINTFYTGIATIDNVSTNATAYMVNSAGDVNSGYTAGSTSVGSGNNLAFIGCGTAGASSYAPGSFFNGWMAEVLVYNRVLDSTERASVIAYLGDKHIPPMASNPNPANGAYAYDKLTTLEWTPTDAATSQTIYFSTDYNDVFNSDAAALKATLASDADTYGPFDVNMSTKYYWRINQIVNGSTSYGQVWSFDVPAYYSVEDFESYVGTGSSSVTDSLRSVWKDGYSLAGEGLDQLGSNIALVSELADPDVIHDDSKVRTLVQSMLFAFDNTGSEITFTYPSGAQAIYTPVYPYAEAKVSLGLLPIGTDWTTQGDWTLEVYFFGQAGNSTSSPLYLAVEDATGHICTPIVYPTSSNIAVAAWNKWEICTGDLATNGVNLANLSKLYIGFGNRNNPQIGGKGTVYFDDIRMHRQAKLAVDLNLDCRIDFKDFAILAEYWLQHAGCSN